MRQLLSDVDPLDRCSSAQELSALLQGLAGVGYRLEDDQAFAEEALRRMQQRQQQRQEQEQRLQQQRAEAAARAAAAAAAPQRGWPLRAPWQQRPQEPQQEPAAGPEDEEEEEEQEEARLAEEARHVAAAVQALERMGARGQAAQLKANYLQQLQARASERLQARVQRQQQKQREEQEQAQQQRAAQQQAQREAAAAARARALQEQQRQEQEARERQRAAAEERAVRQKEAVEQEAQRWRGAVLQAVTSARTWRQLRQLLYSVPSERWGADELAALLSRLPAVLEEEGTARAMSWRERAELSDMLETWGGAFVARVRDERSAGVEALVSCLEAAAALRWLEQRVLGVLLSDLRRQVEEQGGKGLSGRQAARVVVALAEAGLRPSAGWMGALFVASEPKLAGEEEEEALQSLVAGLTAFAACTRMLAVAARLLAVVRACVHAQSARLVTFSRWVRHWRAWAPSRRPPRGRWPTWAPCRPTRCVRRDALCLRARRRDAMNSDCSGAACCTRSLVPCRACCAQERMTLPQASACLQAAAAWDAPLVQRWYRGLVQSRQAAATAAPPAPPPQRPEQPSAAAATPPAQQAPPSTAPTSQQQQEQAPAPALTSLSVEMIPVEVLVEEEQRQGEDPIDTLPGFPAATDMAAVDVPPAPTFPAADSARPPVSAVVVESVDFDEERAAAGQPEDDDAGSGAPGAAPAAGLSGEAPRAAFPPDTFLLDRMAAPPSPAPAAAASPAQVRALRSVLLERLELAEETAGRVAQAQAAAQTRVENAAIQVRGGAGRCGEVRGGAGRNGCDCRGRELWARS